MAYWQGEKGKEVCYVCHCFLYKVNEFYLKKQRIQCIVFHYNEKFRNSTNYQRKHIHQTKHKDLKAIKNKMYNKTEIRLSQINACKINI